MRRSMAVGVVWAWLASLAVAGANPPSIQLGQAQLLGDGPDFVTGGAGVYDVFREGHVPSGTRGHSAMGVIEYRLGRKLFWAGPVAGVLANHEGGVFGYGGFYMDFAWQDWRLTPVFAFGGYRRGESKELGGVFQFHFGATLYYQFDDGLRVGAGLTHISNRDIHYLNPGVEMAFLGLAVPLPTSFR